VSASDVCASAELVLGYLPLGLEFLRGLKQLLGQIFPTLLQTGPAQLEELHVLAFATASGHHKPA
jgi:hypothetical protein